MGRSVFVTALLLGSLASLSLAGCAASSAGCSGDGLDCLARLAGERSHVAAQVQERLQVDDLVNDRGDLKDRMTAFGPHREAVSVNIAGASGAGGTVLLILADQRYVDRESTITKLDQDAYKALGDVHACDELCERVRDKDVSGENLISAGLAKDAAGAPHGSVVDMRPADGVAGWLLAALFAALLALLALLVLLVRRSGTPRLATAAHPGPVPYPRTSAVSREPGRRTAPPGAATSRPGLPVAVPSGPMRTAIVRTELRPQGYVEIDHCLYRAAWADPDASPPAPGDPVDVVDGAGQGSDSLLAVRRGGAERRTP
ncbi:hypothetical protein [Streptomyces sp. NPDC059909]|uniref:hypothetical protein n=1 Tax=Streptomyces sp. NPDC059909 TaxID=3346998 RepID=UPI0036605FBC